MLRAMQSVAELLGAARRQGLELVANSDTLDTMGLDFVVAHARDAQGTQWIVRSPRRPDVVAAARHEARVLALVKGRVGVAVPDWRVHTDEVIAYPRIDGTPLVTLDTGAPVWNIIDPAAPSEAFTESMARFLTALQRIDPAGADIKSQSPAELRDKVKHAFDATREVLKPSERLQARWQRWLDGDTWPDYRVLVHGDLHPGHMLLADGGALAGVLDWTEGMLGDPATDLAMYAGCFGRPALEHLVRRMEALGARTWPAIVDHAMERWAAGPALGALWGLEHDSQAVIEHSRWILSTLDA